MKTLENEPNALSKLSDYRKRAKKLRDDGREALEPITSLDDARGGWLTSGDEVEAALVVLVQNSDVAKRSGGVKESKFIARLTGLKLKDLFEAQLASSSTEEESTTTSEEKNTAVKEEHATVPVLVATRAMNALVATSKYAFSKATLLCYYRIVRELYSADSPDWSTGGARAGSGGESTAFMTGECVRAISAFARTHKQTATFFRRTYEMYRRKKELAKLAKVGWIRPWRDAEIERVGLAWYNSTNAQLGEIALKLPTRKEPEQQIDINYIDKYLSDLPIALEKSINLAFRSFEEARKEIENYREQEKQAAGPAEQKGQSGGSLRRKESQRFIRSESAHQIALSVVEQAVKEARKAKEICKKRENTLDRLKELGDLFDAIGCDIKRILEPARHFLGAVLDRELTAASAANQPSWDARELVFAASSYGAVTGWRQNERLTRACALLSKAVSDRGLLPQGRPFHTTANGFGLYASGFDVSRGFAQLLHKVESPITPQLVGRLLQLFEDNGISLNAEGADGKVCWHAEDPPIPKRPTLWVTAIALLSLDRIVRMLDHKINEVVLSHFSTKRFDKGEKGPRLEDLSFPDYLPRPIPDEKKNHLPLELRRKWSIAVTLEQMRAHVLGTKLPSYYSPPTFSGVLFGPPGTGKTTLLEALARSCGLPLVQVTPSDIARAGVEAIEKSAKMLFDALSMLTRAVIIFDEFEPILLKRETDGQNEERSIFTFLTPGMLPKLKKLYDSAEGQGVAYCLVTNLYENLDKASIRRGRFDEHIYVRHPNFYSRAGIFLDRLYQLKDEVDLDEDQQKRFHEVIKITDGRTIQELTKDLFKVQRKEEIGEDLYSKTLCAYVFDKSPDGALKMMLPPQGDSDHKVLEVLEELHKQEDDNLARRSLWELDTAVSPL
jgi:adenylate kinase family enzyme